MLNNRRIGLLWRFSFALLVTNLVFDHGLSYDLVGIFSIYLIAILSGRRSVPLNVTLRQHARRQGHGVLFGAKIG